MKAAVCLILILFSMPAAYSAAYADDSGRIAVSEKNSRYWQYRGETLLLLGGSDEDNLFNNPAMMAENLDILKDIGGNYIRSTLSCRDEGNVWPYAKNSDGLYDLERFNPEFWDRLETSIREAEKRAIIVQIEFWATFDYYRDNWLVNPFNPKNNINYSTADTKLLEEWNFHPARKPQPFVHSIPKVNNDKLLLKYQEAFVRKVLDITLPYGNVLYSLDNETRAPAEWALYWGDFIKNAAKKKGTSLNITEMWDQWDITHKDHEATYLNHGLFSFTDISQNNWQEGQTHYDRLLWYRDNLAKTPGGMRPMNNVKVYARLSGNRENDYSIGIDRWWRNIFAGCASTRFHRPDSGSGLDKDAQTMIRAARVFTSAFDIFICDQRPDVMDNCEENEAYCLAAPGSHYALFFPKGGEVKLYLEGSQCEWNVRWFDIETATFGKPTLMAACRSGQAVTVRSPKTGKRQLALIEAVRQ